LAGSFGVSCFFDTKIRHAIAQLEDD
jgi:hypothetical protein